MKPDWPLVIKVCITLTFMYFIGGLFYRFVYLQGSGIDLGHFTSYVSVAILLLVSDRLMKRVVLKSIKETSPPLSTEWETEESHEGNKINLGYLFGGLLPIVRWPLVVITVELLEALWGQKWTDGFETLCLKLLGLGSMTSTSSKLIFYLAWFLIGMLILNMSLRFYLIRSNNPGSTEPA